MEAVIRYLAKKMHIKVGPKDTWGGILGGMDGKIKAMPENNSTQKAKKTNGQKRVSIYFM